MLPTDVDVLVVGAGPTGTMASLLLEQMGVTTALIERRASPKPAPAAHVVNARTLEICRAAGVAADEIARIARDPAEAAFAYFVTRVGGRVLGRLPYERQADDQLAFTPTPLRNISQNHFEPLLHRTLERRCGRCPAWRVQWEASTPDGDRVLSHVRDLATGRVHELRSRYVIAADGAGSRIRQSLGIELEGPARLQCFIMIHFGARLRGLPEIPPGMLFFTCDPRSQGGVVVVHDLDHEAVFMHPYDPDREDEASYDAGRCEELVRSAFEDPSLPIEIRNIGSWTMTSQVAQRYRHDRIFLAGDAAHRFPPTGGLGLNSGVQDVHNLAWKIAAVRTGRADATLLDTYERERRPVARRNADQSLANAIRLLEVPQALGLGSSTDSDDALAQMEATLSDPAGTAGVRAAIDAQAEHFDLPGLQLGFVYEDGALVRDPAEPAPLSSPPRSFTPQGAPGARLPHAWLRSPETRRSLLDEVPLDRFVLIVGPEGQSWADAAAALEPLRATVIPLRDTAVHDLDTWLGHAGIGRSGALLVRPDQHVAWRARTAASDPEAVLGALPARLVGPVAEEVA